MHRIIQNRGFTLRRRGLSSDTIIALIVGTTSSLWTAAVLRDVYLVHLSVIEPGRLWNRLEIFSLLAGLSKAPILPQELFGFWIVSWLDGLRAEKVPGAKPHLWSLAHLRGPFDWPSGLHDTYRHVLILSISVSVAIPATAALAVGSPLDGILGLAGLLLFVLDGTADNPYVKAQHRYADDRLRVPLPTSHHEGTVYILPSKGRGIDAVWSPKIIDEHIGADGEMMTLFNHMRSGRWVASEPLERLRRTLALYHERVVISTPQLERLAAWIYCEDTLEARLLRKIKCSRAPNVHHIGRDLMYALCHAEYLVFMGQGRLPPATRAQLGTLRLMSNSGAGNDGPSDGRTIGFRAGIDGYREAVEHVYAIFEIEVDQSALDFSKAEPPRYSSALSKSPDSIDQYVSEVWDMSCEHSESTFTALYYFTTVWFMEVGNVNGFHIFPLRSRTQDGDLVSQQIAWRQAWYSGLTAQLVTSSPLLFSLFAVGLLQ